MRSNFHTDAPGWKFWNYFVLHERLLLIVVSVMRSGRRRGRFRAADVLEGLAVAQDRRQPLVDERPGAHVARLFLHPEDRGGVREAGQGIDKQLLGKG